MMDAARKKAYLYPLMIIGGLFFIFGFVTWAIAVLIPYLQIACELTSLQAMLVSSSFYISYFVMAGSLCAGSGLVHSSDSLQSLCHHPGSP